MNPDRQVRLAGIIVFAIGGAFLTQQVLGVLRSAQAHEHVIDYDRPNVYCMLIFILIGFIAAVLGQGANGILQSPKDSPDPKRNVKRLFGLLLGLSFAAFEMQVRTTIIAYGYVIDPNARSYSPLEPIKFVMSRIEPH